MSTTQHRITPEVLAILSACAVEDQNIRITNGQLARPTYEAVNKVLSLMGGKWNRKAQAHVFDESPVDLLDTVLLTGEITDKKKLFQFFETPVALAHEMVSMLDGIAGTRILEPSAGRGRLIEAAVKRATGFDCLEIVAIELDPVNIRVLEEMRNKWLYANSSNFGIVEGDFLRKGTAKVFSAVLMNPPFSRGAAINHIKHAIGFLKPRGRIIAICPNGPREQAELKPLVHSWRDLPAGTFLESGTNVSTALLEIRA